MKNHLGNTRVAFDALPTDPDVVQVSDYYPFGMQHANSDFENSDNKYLYNGKELQEELDWYDYGARMYDASLGRFHTLDTYAEKVNFQSPYLYASNNPVKYIDVNGKFSFDPKQLDYIKTNYPKAYAIILQADKNKQGVLQWAHSDQVANSMISNTHVEVYKNPAHDMYWTEDKYNVLTKGEIIKAFTPGSGPIIRYDKNPSGPNSADLAGSCNDHNDGTRYTTPLKINERFFSALENASTPEEIHIAYQNFVSIIIHEYLEDFSDDELKDSHGKDTGKGINNAQKEIFGGVQPGFPRHAFMNSSQAYPLDRKLSPSEQAYQKMLQDLKDW